ncbi:MAG: hypothetical protein GHCLOJNM_04595 [bacterium]|nr:hypothetical protein [bacterium]
MIGKRVKRATATATAVAVACAWSAIASAAYIEFTPATSEVFAGDTFGVGITIGGLDESEIVSGFDLTALYDPALLGATGFAFSSLLGVPGLDTLTDTLAGSGSFNVFNLSFLSDEDLFALQGSSVLLGTLQFTALAVGSTILSFAPLFGGDVSGAGCWFTVDCALGIDRLGTALVNVRERVVDVPEPGALGLLLAGLFGLYALRRRYPPPFQAPNQAPL